MLHFPEGIRFKYPWRKYQQRVLDELDTHLEDDHLHIIAPPGSGKTILGLEVALRLDRPTLIFAPTIAIRNQWIQRFAELFLQTEMAPSWISRDIKAPGFLTVSTYQGLHAACTGGEEKEEEETEEDSADSLDEEISMADGLIALLKAQNIGSIIVDEAHHLKNAWWESLDMLKQQLKPTIVGLTATPPYDVTYVEWQRYLGLNGPVDAEISVPELVVEGDLCPHQDFVLLSCPTENETTEIAKYVQRIDRLVEEIKADPVLRTVLSSHQIFTHPTEELEWIYSNLEEYSAVLIFLHAIGVELVPEHLEVIGDTQITIPELDHEWMEVLLKFYLFSKVEVFGGTEAHKEQLLNRLKRHGAFERNRITLGNAEKRKKILGSSLSKLNSIQRIVAFESDELGKDLRMVILTDYIRKEYMVRTRENELEIEKIGVLPIFEVLRRSGQASTGLAVLSGSVVILPTDIVPLLKEASAACGIEEVATSTLPYDPAYTLIKTSHSLKHEIVHIVTELFEAGHIRILVGTKSLLGEGWDAPAINSLILASFVGSFVLSNQMRGRAIRAQKTNKNKTGNIWHLVCAELGETEGGADMELLKRRFKAFVGVTYGQRPTIENGVDRLEIPAQLESVTVLEAFNSRIFEEARDRLGLEQAWMKALQGGDTLREEIKLPFPEGEDYQSAKMFRLKRLIIYLIGLIIALLLLFGPLPLNALLRRLEYTPIPESGIWLTSVIGFIGAVIFGSLLYRSFHHFMKYHRIAKEIEDIGVALLDTLSELELMATARKELNVVSSQDKKGAVYCHLEGGTTFERSLFIQSMVEIVGEVDNPRYLIVRAPSAFDLKGRKEFYCVPESIGRLKSMALVFEKNWRRQVGECELLFTRNLEGRKILLRARLTSNGSEKEDGIQRVNMWK